MGSYESEEPLSAEVTATLAETLIGVMRDGGDAALVLGFTRSQLKNYFLAIRNAHIGAAWYLVGGDMKQLTTLLDNLDTLENLNNPALDNLIKAADFNLGMPVSESALYRIISELQQETEDGQLSRFNS